MVELVKKKLNKLIGLKKGLLSKICGSLVAWADSQVHDIRQLPRPDRYENHRNFS